MLEGKSWHSTLKNGCEEISSEQLQYLQSTQAMKDKTDISLAVGRELRRRMKNAFGMDVEFETWVLSDTNSCINASVYLISTYFSFYL